MGRVKAFFSGVSQFLFRAVIASAILGAVGFGFGNLIGAGGAGVLFGVLLGLLVAVNWTPSSRRATGSYHGAEGSGYVAGSGFVGGFGDGGGGCGGGDGGGGGAC